MEMNSETKGRGFIIRCSREGIIKDIIRNELKREFPFDPKENIHYYLDHESLIEYKRFFAEVAESGTGLGWKLNLKGQEKNIPLTFAGVLDEEDFFVVAAENADQILDYYEELIKRNSPYGEKIRDIIKRSFTRNVTRNNGLPKNAEVETYHHISTLNNELTNMQRTLTKKNIDLKRLDKQKNEYLGMAVHDLRNPIGTIMGYSEILKGEIQAQLNDEQREMLDLISSSSEYMLKIIDDFLDVSKIQLGNLQLDKYLINIEDLVRHNISNNLIVARQKDINLEYLLKGESPFAKVDPGKLNQVLNNLIGNSVKFSPSHSSIKVTVSSDHEKVIIEVSDQGLGISMKDKEKLFKPYQQTDTKSTEGEKGEGLGLAIVKKIIKGHGGDIKVESEEGKGSRFSVLLPKEEVN
ncbi:sensor histidine kinase [Isachenkonia alkalipeptolytica]|nr:HAMP domain-containing sensor histidine kinase [Isachenkonia alkalipeptolytica]